MSGFTRPLELTLAFSWAWKTDKLCKLMRYQNHLSGTEGSQRYIDASYPIDPQYPSFNGRSISSPYLLPPTFRVTISQWSRGVVLACEDVSIFPTVSGTWSWILIPVGPEGIGIALSLLML